LGWGDDAQGVFGFLEPRGKILLDFDLDCFSVNWGDYTFAWPDEIFAKEFTVHSDYRSTGHWTGASFVQALVRRAGMVTFATEPDYCGGSLDVRRIKERLNRFVFDNELIFPEQDAE
jgi:hypothetical protein